MERSLDAQSRRRRRLSIAVVAAVLPAALFWSLGSTLAASSSPSPVGAKKIILQVGWYENLDSLNLFVGQQNVSSDVYRLNYDQLVNYDPKTLAPIPGVATSWTHSADGKTWTFKIRQGIKWRHGLPLAASDVAFTFNWIGENQMTSCTAYAKSIKDAVAVNRETTLDAVADLRMLLKGTELIVLYEQSHLTRV
jgi:ABC-type transport system substrate-binding protein